MRKTNYYKFFIENNTFKIQVDTMLNRLRKHKDSKVIDAIRLIIDGKAQDPLLVEIAILNSLMNHPEHYIKNIDPETKRTIQNEIKVTLETFILELNDEVVSSKPGVRA